MGQCWKFFERSELLDHMALRPLWHIRPNWELSWDRSAQRWVEEEESFAAVLNLLVDEIDAVTPPCRYHDQEDRLAEFVISRLGWPIRKEGGRWIGADYGSILEQGGFVDVDQENLVLAAAGRIHAARRYGQESFDDMEESHQRMLAAVLAVILYHRS